MPDPIAELLDLTRLLFDLQRGNEIAQHFSGCLNPDAIAKQVTDGLVTTFNCAFARIWLLEPDQTTLKLVASSGMYTNTDGFFARVPMGAYKVGKIAQNRVSFLSNNLADEPWVGNREWAIANNIRGFAGYPLLIKGRVVGVLAVFSHHTMAPEFLEVLQTLCTMLTVALDAAFQHQHLEQSWQSSNHHLTFNQLSLSDQLAAVLTSARLTLVGTEQSLTLSLAHVFLKTAEILNQMECAYCRLIYAVESVALEAIVSAPELTVTEQGDWVRSALGNLSFTASCLGGMLQTQISDRQRAVQILLKLPYPHCTFGERLRIQCRFPVLQMAFTHLSFLAGLRVCETTDEAVPLLTDDVTQLQAAKRIVWIHQPGQTIPKGVRASVDLSIEPQQLGQAIAAVNRDQPWGIEPEPEAQPLSERELEIMSLLTHGLRDRDIASKLVISESTVKFHINNSLAKLKAKTRYQALHQAMINGWVR